MTQLYPHYREPLGVQEEHILVARTSKKDSRLKAAVCFSLGTTSKPFSVRYTKRDADGGYYATVNYYDVLTDAMTKFKRVF